MLAIGGGSGALHGELDLVPIDHAQRIFFVAHHPFGERFGYALQPRLRIHGEKGLARNLGFFLGQIREINAQTRMGKDAVCEENLGNATHRARSVREVVAGY